MHRISNVDIVSESESQFCYTSLIFTLLNTPLGAILTKFELEIFILLIIYSKLVNSPLALKGLWPLLEKGRKI